MPEKNIVAVPDQARRAANRRARQERRRALAERRANAVEAVDEDDELAPLGRGEVAPMQVDTFVLPPRAHLENTTSKFTQFIRLSFLIGVVVPTLVCALFYGFVASDQYSTDSAFAVRGSSSSSSSIDVASMMGAGMATPGSEVADSYILAAYVQSREMVEALISEANFLEIYSRPSADPFYRLDPTLTIEELVEYWEMMSTVEFETDTGIIRLTVRAFRPADAETITRKVIEKSEALVNELSVRAREDSVKMARNEVQLAEQRFADARKAVAAYRGTEREIDPTATATARQTLVGNLQADLANKEAQLSALRKTMSANSPRVVYMQNQIDALSRQIAAERLSVAVPENEEDSQPVLTDRLSRYEELLAERQFAEQNYISSLSTLEAARMEALKQQRYLAVFVRGTAPEDSLYPEGIRWTLILFGSLLLGWGVIAMIGAAVRDRMA